MISKVPPKLFSAGFVIAAAIIVLYVLAPFAAGQTPETPDAQTPQLDYEFFKTRVEPIFLKRRSADHARCYACHVRSHHGDHPLSLQPLSPGSSFWTEEQSRLNFQTVSKLVVPGAPPTASLFLRHPLAPEAGGDAFHTGGRQFGSQDDPDWKIMAEWVGGQKVGGSSTP